MHPNEQFIVAVAEILSDAVAMNKAALAGDTDESRFRAQLIARKASDGRHQDLSLVAAELIHVFGPSGSTPSAGYGTCMLRIANVLERTGFEPL